METSKVCYNFLASPDFFSSPIFIKKKNPQISHFLKYGPDKGDGDVDGDGENFNIEKISENEMAYSQHV